MAFLWHRIRGLRLIAPLHPRWPGGPKDLATSRMWGRGKRVFICPAYVLLTTVKWQFFNNLCCQTKVECVLQMGNGYGGWLGFWRRAATADATPLPLSNPAPLQKPLPMSTLFILLARRRLWNFREFMSTWEQAPSPKAALFPPPPCPFSQGDFVGLI